MSIHGWVSSEKRVASSTYKGYYLRDRYGDLILVRSTEAVPDVNTEVTITGVALRDADTQAVYVSESRRALPAAPAPAPAPAVAPSPGAGAPGEAGAGEGAVAGPDQRNLLLAGIGAAVVVLIGLAVFLMRRKEAPPAATSAGPVVATSETERMSRPVATGAGVEEYRTVKVYKTTKVLPGKLVTLQGGAETDTIHLYDQTGRGEVEIGRDSPDVREGIRIKDGSNTMSRRQARVQYAAGKREFEITNLAGESSNPTAVNGRELQEKETAVLRDGDVVRLGNVELKFRQG